MNPWQPGLDHASLRKCITDPPAKRVHHVFFRMSVSRKVDPFAPPPLLAIISDLRTWGNLRCYLIGRITGPHD
jgi:hypothetical protein